MKVSELSCPAAERGKDHLLFGSHPFFQDLNPARVEEILEHSEIRQFKPGEYLFRQGEPADRLFLLLKGHVVLEIRANRGHYVRISECKDQDVIGWSWSLPPFAWHFQAQALELTTALVCNGAYLLVLCEDDPVFGYTLMKHTAQIVVRRLESVQQQLANIERILNPVAPSPLIH